ncbi:vWA domain-containing protein [Methanosphaera stadtmanae]|uniref:vWA domain-containing protein n=1 Tax=Methanosphaera stadtmanae TaxID=2317 RepID=UPI0026DC2A01|nr:VWA-like domain-containing protein [Methanosphaera stadtmanae]
MKYDIAALKRKMLVKYPFFGSVVASVGYEENKDIPTAATDGETIYYNSEYLEGLSVEEQTFVFAHEVCHIAFNHILRSEGKNPELWNIATDGVINQFLKRDGLKMAPGGIDMAEAINYDAEQLYEKLLQEKQQRQQQGGQGNSQQQSQSQQQGNLGSECSQQQEKQSQEQSDGESGEDSQKEDKSKQDVGHDTHSMWEQAVKKHKKQQEKSDKKESLLDKLLRKNKKDIDKKYKEKDELEKKQEELESMGEKDAFKKNLEDKKKQLQELKEEISKQALQVGTSTNRNIRAVNDIGTAKPLIDWRYVLREAIKYDVDWSYKNATLEDGVVSANLEEQPMPETEIVLDTSGSINEVLLKNFLRECKNILQHTKLKVGCFDTRFYGFHEIRTEEDIEKMRFEGGGGTDFDVAVGAFSRRVENKIIFTDGAALMPDMPLDAIWIVFGVESINPKGGKVIHIDNEQLERLYNYQMTNETKGRSR